MTIGRTHRHLFLLLIIASLEFLWRGPGRTLRNGEFTDLTVPYVASRLWLSGANPYDPTQFMGTWIGAGGQQFVTRGSPTNRRPAYPPSTLPALAILAFFHWPMARDLFLFITVVLFVLLLRALLRLGSIELSGNSAVICCALALALAPWQGAIALQNISALAIELAVIGSSLHSEVWGGSMLGAALCLKPQLAAWFILSDVIQKRWRRAVWSLALFAAVTILALWRLPHGWLDAYRDNLRYFFVVGDVNDFTTRNLSRFELLNLQVIFYYVTRMYWLSNILSWGATACLLLWWRLGADHRPEKINLAAVALIGLLPFYQRIFSAGLIVLVLPYALARWKETKARIILIASSVFLVPGAAILQVLLARHWISRAMWDRSWLLNLLVGPHATWAVLAIIVTLLLWYPAAVKEPLTTPDHAITVTDGTL